MRVAVTGSTGFIGRHVVDKLLDRGIEVLAIGRSTEKARSLGWFDRVDFREHDLDDGSVDAYAKFDRPELLIHLAWQGMPLYNDPIHLERALPSNFAFLRTLIDAGLPRLVVVGTCFEYGLVNGCLSEDHVTDPVTLYGIAKDTLRKWLQWYLRQRKPADGIDFKWLRLFFMYGEGQHPQSLMSQLDEAIRNKHASFRMSGGEQLRDYLRVDEVADAVAVAACQADEVGIINCCSGKPISIRRLVENIVAERGAEIRLELGYYPYPKHEPMAFWGDRRKLDRIMASIGSRR